MHSKPEERGCVGWAVSQQALQRRSRSSTIIGRCETSESRWPEAMGKPSLAVWACWVFMSSHRGRWYLMSWWSDGDCWHSMLRLSTGLYLDLSVSPWPEPVQNGTSRAMLKPKPEASGQPAPFRSGASITSTLECKHASHKVENKAPFQLKANFFSTCGTQGDDRVALNFPEPVDINPSANGSKPHQDTVQRV